MPRIWATLGNMFRIQALGLLVFCLILGYGAVQRAQVTGVGDISVLSVGAAALIGLLGFWLLWMVKPVLITNRPRIIGPVVRILVGGSYLLGWLIAAAVALTYYKSPAVLEYLLFSALLNVLYFGIVYAFTGEPAAYEYASSGPRQEAPKFKAPTNFEPTGRVGPSGAMLYSDSQRSALIGQFESYIPIQVLEERNGFSHVVAGNGQSGWIDNRTVSAV